MLFETTLRCAVFRPRHLKMRRILRCTIPIEPYSIQRQLGAGMK
jgi:hypothetical protein